MSKRVTQQDALNYIAEARKYLKTAAMYVTGDVNAAQKRIMLLHMRHAKHRLARAIRELEKVEPTP